MRPAARWTKDKSLARDIEKSRRQRSLKKSISVGQWIRKGRRRIVGNCGARIIEERGREHAPFGLKGRGGRGRPDVLSGGPVQDIRNPRKRCGLRRRIFRKRGSASRLLIIRYSANCLAWNGVEFHPGGWFRGYNPRKGFNKFAIS